MTKGSGINYFIDQVGVSDLVKVFYTFESGQTYVPSVSGGNSLYSGLVNGNTSVFWQKPGSGFFSGTYLTVNGFESDSFLNLFSFEVFSTGKQLICSNLDDTSGYEIGLNDAHKAYFRSRLNGVDVYATSNANISSKNLISVGYVTNNVEIGYYNFNSKKFETESFNQSFGNVKSNKQFVIGSGFTGYIDYFLNFDLFLSSDSLSQIASGWAFIPTGYTYQTEEICTQKITGYAPINYIKTGFVGYSGSILAADGVGDFTGAFPSSSTGFLVTGIVESGIIQSGLSHQECVTVTGAREVAYQVLTGYAKSFGMDKVFIANYLDNKDLVKVEREYGVFRDFYNKKLLPINSGFYSELNANTGFNLFLNGVGITNSGVYFNQNIVSSQDFSILDEIIYDIGSGSKHYYQTGFNSLAFNYIGQQIYLNGQNLISGDGFTVNGGALSIIGGYTGISGVVFEFPVSLPFETGSKYVWTGQRFARNGALVFLNGIRQIHGEDYLEGSNYDLLKSNNFNEYNNFVIYDNEGTFWE